MIASTSLFFTPEWPRKLFYKLKRKQFTSVADTKVSFSSYIPPKERKLSFFQCFILFVVLVFLIWWVVMPIRFLWMPGPQVWTEDGHMVCIFIFFDVFIDFLFVVFLEDETS